MLDELALAGPEHLDADYVATYDAKAAFDPSPDVELLRAHGLGPESTVVDLGAGTGTFALAAARHARRVVAVDVSPAMVAALHARAAPNVEVVRAGFLSYRHEGEPPDVVWTRNALHHLPDFWKAVALRRIAELLRPGGILRLRDLVFAFEPSDADEVLEAWLARAADDPAHGWTRAELEAHIRDEHSTYTWLLEPMLEHAGFEILEARAEASPIYADYVCRVRSGIRSSRPT